MTFEPECEFKGRAVIAHNEGGLARNEAELSAVMRCLSRAVSQVDMFSFGMFMYEVISLHFPFEKQNLMSSQIEKLVIDGERPPLQSRVSQSVLATRDKCTM